MVEVCPCCSGQCYEHCCAPFHQNITIPATAEALMRSRYSAYALHLITYLLATTHPSKRHLYHQTDVANWAKENNWLKLEICKSYLAIVEFKVHYEYQLIKYIHHERSTFKKDDGRWYYFSGIHL